MIMFDGKDVIAHGTLVDVVTETGCILVSTYQAVRAHMEEKFALATMVRMIESVIEHEQIEIADILEAIKIVGLYKEEKEHDYS